MKIIILDFATTETYVFDYDTNSFEDIYSFFDFVMDKHGILLRESQCQWMIVEELKINIR